MKEQISKIFSKSTSESRKTVEVVSFDVPYPPNYGGVIDVYYKIRAFRKAGIRVNLHCFEYGRPVSKEMEGLCEKVHYYKRNISKANLFRRRPYIVVTRSSEDLLLNLARKNNPILFEGLHTCYYLDHKKLKKKKKIVRTHNIEHDYYQNLAKVERDIFKRYYFSNESQKLRRYERILEEADGIAAISLHDKEYFSKSYKNVINVSAFHPHEFVDIKPGTGNFALYHGSLTVGENNEAAIWLINNVFNDADIPLIIAGNKPSAELKNAIALHQHITLKSDVSTSEIYQLVQDAQVNILPTFQSTGIKLKLLAALFTGRHCIVNKPMVIETGLEKMCIVKDSAEEMKIALHKVFNKPFEESDIKKRRDFLENSIYSNEYNINQLINLLF
jgi:hypothetical protein